MATETQKPANLVEKLAAVMAAVERVPKNGENKFHGYKYATEADLSDAVRSNLARYGVMLIPSVESLEWREVDTKRGKERIATLRVKFTATDGATEIAFHVIGEGQDPGDKATYKAMTGAMKYALLKLFLIPTGDDPETEEGEAPHTGSRAAPKNGAAHQTPAPAAPAKTNGVPPPHVAALWQRVREAKGEGKASNTPKTRAAFAEAGRSIWGDNPKPSHDWTVEDAKAVEAAILGPEDINF
jgi:hypothetical protein